MYRPLNYIDKGDTLSEETDLGADRLSRMKDGEIVTLTRNGVPTFRLIFDSFGQLRIGPIATPDFIKAMFGVPDSPFSNEPSGNDAAPVV